MKRTSLIRLSYLLLSSLVLIPGCSGDDTSTASSSTPTSETSESSTESTSSSSSVTTDSGEYVFEAEYAPNIEDIEGRGFSGTATGTSIIIRDVDGSMEASNGYYVSYLYSPGLYLDFTINSSEAVSDATFIFRISAEFMDITLSPSIYSVLVNNVAVNYDDISIDTGASSAEASPFVDYTLTESLSLNEGENTVRLLTSNEQPMLGTMTATAPIIDCFKIKTSATLTWEPCTSNLG